MHGVVVALIVIGVFESVLHPTASTVIADVVPAETRRESFAARRVMASAGGMAGPALGALLALHSLGLVFLGAGLTILIGALIVAVFLVETRPADDEPEDDNDESLLALTAVFRDCRLAGLVVPVALLEIVASWIAAITPLYADAGDTLTASGIGLLFAYAGALGVLLQMPITKATGRMSGFAIVLCSGALQALAFICLLLAPALPLLVAAVTLLTLAAMLSGPLVQTIVTELAPRSGQATYQAAFGVVNDLKDAAGPALGTWLFALSAALPGAPAPSSRLPHRLVLPPPRAAMKAGRDYLGNAAARSLAPCFWICTSISALVAAISLATVLLRCATGFSA